MRRPHQVLALAVGAFALVGVAFSIVSTHDFIEHLDRQVHSISCGFFPGSNPDVAGTSGCHAVMMSPYSSVLRTALWGGIPISLLAMGVFGYLLFRAADLLIRRRTGDASETRFLVAATGLPVLMSLIYGGISFFVIDAVCTNCMGVYVASLGGFIAAILLNQAAGQDDEDAYDDEDAGDEPAPTTRYALYFGEGVLFVALPLLAFLMMRPDYSTFVGKCGELEKPDASKVLVPLHTSATGTPSIEILDPLCPACRAFDERLGASGLQERLNLSAVLFPLDSTCNWMVPGEVHPGACMVSEAVICAQADAPKVVDWAFKNQEALKETAKADKAALQKQIEDAFPGLKGCVGTKEARYKLNQSLRWAVANRIPVLTPQLYVDNKKLCDEDTDLGLEFALSRMLDGMDGSAMSDDNTLEAR